MAVKKLSVALEEEVAQAAARCAERAGVSLSAWLSQAAERAVSIEDGLAAVADWEQEHGTLSEAELSRAEAILTSAEVATRTG